MGFSANSSESSKPLKILSLPCATGEEPYSIAMALCDAGLSESDFHINAIDVSKRALTKAKRAIYGQHFFRDDDVNIKENYFKKNTNKEGFYNKYGGDFIPHQ